MQTKRINNNERVLRYGMLVPLALMIASLVSSCLSYSDAEKTIANDLNETMIALANDNIDIWTHRDTISALRHMHKATHKPMIYKASDLNFRNKSLRNDAYFTLSLVDRKNGMPVIQGNKRLALPAASRFASDSIMLVPEKSIDGLAVQLQGFADCSMASIFAASNQTLPGILFTLSLLSMASMVIWRRRDREFKIPETASISTVPAIPSVDSLKLTPMQRRFTLMLLEAPDMKVDKSTLCAVLWDNKTNAEESLYTLVRRTKTALASSNIEIICNRGESYQLRIND